MLNLRPSDVAIMRAWATQVSQQESSSDYERRSQQALAQQRRSAAIAQEESGSGASASKAPEPSKRLSQTFQSKVQLDAHCRVKDGNEALSHLPALPPKEPLQVGLRADQVEPWQRFPYLETGYRKHGSHWECAKSMLFGPLHNETVNAWTMVLSLALGTWMFVGALTRAAPSGWDATPFWVLYLAQLLHCPVSVGYHTFMPISAITAHRWRKADLCLVLALNVACAYALCYFTLHWLLTLALTAIAGVCAATGMRDILLLKPGQALNRSRVIVRVAGTALGYYGTIFWRGIRAAVLARHVLMPWQVPDLVTAFAMLACHFIGAICYAKHWPQKQFPRLFDLVGFSHNIMHVFCMLIYVAGFPYLERLYAERSN